jgi:hypothetical protein
VRRSPVRPRDRRSHARGPVGRPAVLSGLRAAVADAVSGDPVSARSRLSDPSPAVLGRIGREYAAAVERFIVEHKVPVERFQKGQVKEEIARKYFEQAEAEGRFGVVMVGVAQERTSAWRGWREGGPDGHPHFEYRRQSIFPNNYYWYIRDPDWGRGFLEDHGVRALLGMALPERQ